MKIYLALLISLITPELFSQSFQMSLSPQHQQKLSAIESGHQRMLKFYKFYRKDSTKHFKAEEKKYKKILDSAWRAESRKEQLTKQLVKKGIIKDGQITTADSLNIETTKWYAVLHDSTSSDSIKTVARSKVKALALERARQYPGFQHLEEKYKIYGDTIDWQVLSSQVPGLDTLSGLFESKPEELFKLSEDLAMQKLGETGKFGSLGEQLSKAGELKSLPEKYKEQYSQYMNKDNLEEEGKKKAVDEAIDYFSEHAKELEMAQQKLSKLLSKYREFSNSGDLSDAVKRTSLKGSTFWERLIIGGNFNVISTDPVSIDLSPQLGYKFNTRFNVGVAANYRHTFNDSIQHGWYVSPVNTAFKVFSNYDVIKGFYATAEWEIAGVKAAGNDRIQRQWINNYFIGAGKKFLVHPKVYMTVTALYNLNGENENPSYPRRFQMRIGFQLSELATRKKKIYYDPNR